MLERSGSATRELLSEVVGRRCAARARIAHARLHGAVRAGAARSRYRTPLCTTASWPRSLKAKRAIAVSSACGARAAPWTHLRAHETDSYLVCRLLLEKKNKK